MKLLMTGRVDQVNISNENRENMMKAIIQEVSLSLYCFTIHSVYQVNRNLYVS